MFLERWGKQLFTKISLPLFYILMLSPLLFTAALIYMEKSAFQELEDRFSAAVRKGKLAMERKAKKERFLHRYSHPDPYFLDQEIESLVFLRKEKERLQSLLHHPALPRKEPIQERLSYLAGSDNRLSFIEENIRSSNRIKETEERQRHPVQLDEEDLQRLLSLIEDLPIGSFSPLKQSPQLLIRDLKLKKLTTPLLTSVFEMELDLLKREFLKP